ncbi:hypothetical protein [Streptomyces sp. NRRL S-813]|uniref:hypothetical protein n=1 Tax=Streptomyces sp. NRRL S-813 TaxID=1463919 RepID=UPI003B63D095
MDECTLRARYGRAVRDQPDLSARRHRGPVEPLRPRAGRSSVSARPTPRCVRPPSAPPPTPTGTAWAGTPAGSAPDTTYWSDPGNHALAWRIDGTEFSDPSSALYVGYNGWSGDVDFTLPSPGAGKSWYRVTDTSTWAERRPGRPARGGELHRRRRDGGPPARPCHGAADRQVGRHTARTRRHQASTTSAGEVPVSVSGRPSCARSVTQRVGR